MVSMSLNGSALQKKSTNHMATKVWFITDNRGTGTEIANVAVVDGNQVATICRKPEFVTKALSSSDNLLPVVPDVTRVDQVKVAALLPIIAVVFIAYLVIGLALPVLPLHVHEGLGLGTFGVTLTGLGYSLVYPRFWHRYRRSVRPVLERRACG
jgi:hypothetical protein